MAKESFIFLRRFAGLGLILLLLGFCAAAQAQTPAPPFVVLSSATTPEHSISPKWGQTTGVAVAPTGDVVFLDVEKNHLWHVPVDGRAVIDLGPIASASWQNNFGLGIDSKMNLYFGGNYAINGVYKVPYDPVAKSWPLANKIAFVNGGGLVPNPPGFTQTCGSDNNCWGFQPSVVAVDPNDNLVVATTGGAPDKFEIFTVPVNPDGTANLAGGQLKAWGTKARVDWMAADKAGNIFFVEEGYAGVFMLPAGQMIIGDGTGSMEKDANGLPTAPLVRLDLPKAGGGFLLDGQIKGVAVDDAGNVYYGTQDATFNDGQQGGIWMVPNEGTVDNPVLNPAHTVLVTPMRTLGFAVDSKRRLIWSSTIPSSWGNWNGFQDILKVSVGWVDLGAAAVGHSGSTVTVFSSFNHDDSVANNPNVELGFDVVGKPSGSLDFEKQGGNCGGSYEADGAEVIRAYHQNDRCSMTLAVKPTVVGLVEGAIAVHQKIRTGTDTGGNPTYQLPFDTIATAILQGMGTGGELALLASPVETTSGTAITGASQVATDAEGNVFVAASGLHAVQVYPPNSGAAAQVGKNLTAPTGVAVDGFGNVYIADNGEVIRVPYQQGANGNWTWNADAQVAIKTGLGGSLKLAANSAGYLFVADPDNQRVLKIRIYYPPTLPAALTPPSGVASIAQTETAITFPTLTGIGLDNAGNLLFADGTNVIRVDDHGYTTEIASNIGAANELAMDPSGALYYTTVSGAFRVPGVGGALSVDDKLALGNGVTAAAGIALDRTQNIYIADTTAANLHVLSVNGVLNFGTINLGEHPTLDSQVFNVGNAPVTFTVGGNGLFPNSTDLWNGFTITNFTAAGAAVDGCDGVTPTPLAVGGSCFVATTFNPDNGQQGALTGQITLSSDAVNVPVVLNASGTGAALGATNTAIAVATGSNANSAPVTVTVTPQTGSQIPTGDVIILIDGVVAKTLVGGHLVDARGTLGADGKVSFDMKPVKAGNHSYKAAYGGDRTYGRSTASSNVSIAKGVTSISQSPLTIVAANPATCGDGTPNTGCGSAAFLPYVLANIQNADAYVYKYKVSVIAGPAAEGMVPTPQDCNNTTPQETCGKVLLVDSAQVIQNRAAVDQNTGVATLASSGFTPNPDSKALHPVTEFTVTPVYPGDDNYMQAVGTPITFKLVRTPSVLISKDGGEGAITVAAGSSASANLSAKAMFGFGIIAPYTGQVEFQCDNLPPYATCAFSPARVTVVGQDRNHAEVVGHTTLTITTNVPVGVVASKHSPAQWLFATTFAFGLVGLVFGRKSRMKGRLLMVICAALIISGALAGMTACGTSSGASANPAAKTPTGTYTVAVTGKHVNSGCTVGQQCWQQDWASIPYSVTVNVQ